MTTDTSPDDTNSEMVKLNVKIPRHLLEELDELAEELNYSNRGGRPFWNSHDERSESVSSKTSNRADSSTADAARGAKQAGTSGIGSNRSEFVREILYDMTKPNLTSGATEGVAEGYADVAAGRTMSVTEAKNRLGIKDETDD